ncbi:MAG: 6,7-dimethyl-8-ribityllumazine synthase [Planctomycetota bacterium]
MVTVLDCGHDGRGKRVGIAVARFNEVVTERLCEGAVAALEAAGVAAADITVCWVPGAFELPAACRRLWDTGRFDAVVLLGAVVRGGTDHYEHVCTGVTRGAMELTTVHGVALGFGLRPARRWRRRFLERAGGTGGNKGLDAAQAALAMANLRTRLARAGD